MENISPKLPDSWDLGLDLTLSILKKAGASSTVLGKFAQAQRRRRAAAILQRAMANSSQKETPLRDPFSLN